MKRFWFYIASLALIALLIAPTFVVADSDNGISDTSSTKVLTLKIADDIKAGTALDVSRAISQAEEAGVRHLIIQLDTPGGLLQSTRDIITTLNATDLEVIVYVSEPSGWALSAGTIILLGADSAYMHPSATIGAAQPFTPGDTQEVQDEKVLEATISWVRSLAAINQRDPDIAERFVAENLTLSGEEAVELGMVDGLASDMEELLSLIDLEAAEIVEVESNIVSAVFNVLSSPYLISLFLTLGGLTLILAIRSGEFAVSTGIGVVLLLIGLWGIGIIEFSFIGIGLLLVGVILLMIELFDQPGFGIYGLAGIVAIIFGVLSLSQEPFYAPAVMDTVSLVVFATLALAIVAFAIVARGIANTFKTAPVSGAEALVGKEAEALGDITSSGGRVMALGENWQAKTSENAQAIKQGDKCTIIELRGNTLIVEPISSLEKGKE